MQAPYHSFFLALLCVVHFGAAETSVLKHIGCDVCEHAIVELHHLVSAARSNAPYKKLDEGKIQSIMEAVCKPDAPEGKWIRTLDIVPETIDKKTKLQLTAPGGVSKCKKECNLIASSCENLLVDDIEFDDLSSILWKGKTSLEKLKKTVCTNWSSRCPNKSFLSIYIDEPFKQISDKDYDIERMVAQMRAAGMGLSMKDRDDMESMMGDFEEEDDL